MNSVVILRKKGRYRYQLGTVNGYDSGALFEREIRWRYIYSLLLIWSVLVTFVTKLLIFDDYAAKNPIDIEIEQILFLVSILRTYSGR